MSEKRLLITGAGGFLGQTLCRSALSGWTVYGAVRRRSPFDDRVHSAQTDLTSPRERKRLFAAVRPHAVIHAAAEANPNRCQKHSTAARRINVDASIHIAELCAEREIPCLFTSTDLVFDGHTPPYSETDLPSPISTYGFQKAEAEKEMAARYPQTVICRLPLMFGYCLDGPSGFEAEMVRSLASRKRVGLFFDEFRTPVDTESIASALLWILNRGIHGIIHLGGRTRISRYQMGRIAARRLGADPSLLDPISRNDVEMPAPRPADVSLDSERAFSLGYAPADFETAYRGVIRRLATGP
ncbi:MAG: SDR family oxidoreductase [Thermodesulfobacteriota bacterium]